MNGSYVVVNDVPIKVETWGKWIEDGFREDETELVLFITGNPGLPGYYDDFLSATRSKFKRDIPIWIVGHAGHDIPLTTKEYDQIPETKNNLEKYNLDGQIESKVQFIKKYVPSHVKIYLVGHSVGTWIILNLLKKHEIANQVKFNYLLFPTVERLYNTPNGGEKMDFTFRNKTHIIRFVWFLSVLPLFIRKAVIYISNIVMNLPISSFTEISLKILNCKTVENIITLAEDEMLRIAELDVETITKNLKRIKFYYGATDGWVPLKYYTELKERIPEVDAEVDKFNIPHIFTSRPQDVVEMSNLLSKWINELE